MRTTNYDALFKAMQVALEQVQELDKAVKRHEERKAMTDLSKIDFTQLKLEPIIGVELYVASRNTGLSLMSDGLPIAYINSDKWVLASHVSGYTREQVNELWKRTEQVDEFIRQQSRRRITVLELAKELVENYGSPITIEHCGGKATFHFSVSAGAFFETGIGCHGSPWSRLAQLGKLDTVVTVID